MKFTIEKIKPKLYVKFKRRSNQMEVLKSRMCNATGMREYYLFVTTNTPKM